MKLYLIFTIFIFPTLQTYEAQGKKLKDNWPQGGFEPRAFNPSFYLENRLRLGKVTVSPSNHQDIIKISSVKGSSDEDDQLLAKTSEFSTGINRKLMTKFISSSSTTSLFKKNNDDGNKQDQKPKIKSTNELAGKEETNSSTNSISPESSKQMKTEVTEHYPDAIDIAGMDYTPARKKSPIHN